jgi:hypothetical protein
MPRPPRALIIACENYPDARDVATKLAGTLRSASDFYTWLIEHKKLNPTNIYVCCDDPLGTDPTTRTFKANRAGIKKAIVELCKAGLNDSSELYVFFSGHGVGWQVSPQQRGLDLLLASDYQDRNESGDSCIKLDQLRSELRARLGGEDHYYFIDACRTVLNVGEIQAVDLGLTLPLSANEEPTTYVLYATKFGEPAKVNSGFGPALMKGLRGVGRAKERRQGQWWVRFERVQQFVQENVKGKTDLALEGGRRGLILPLPDPQTSPCTVIVDGAAADDDFELTVAVGGIAQSFKFSGASFQKDLSPSDDGYRFQLMKGDRRFQQVDPPANRFVDLFDPTTLRFGHLTGDAENFGSSTLPPPSGITIPPITAANIALRVRNATTGDIVVEPVSGPNSTWVPVNPGRYVAEILDRGRVARSQPVVVGPGERRRIDLMVEPGSRVQRSVMEHLPNNNGLPDASETLRGPLVDQDTAMWLTILGASRLIQPPQNFRKLGPIPLASFDDLEPDDSAVYVIAGLENGDSASVSISRDSSTQWTALEPVPTLDGVFHLRRRLRPGPLLVSFTIPGMPPVTHASYALPNRAALIVFAVSHSGEIVMRQMLLPVYSLMPSLSLTVRERFEDESLHLIKYLTNAQKLFAARQSVAPATEEDKARWQMMLFGKWIDPLLALMAIFDAIRRGHAHANRESFAVAVGNLMQYFGELPDVHAAAQALGFEMPAILAGTPLLLDSLQRAPHSAEWKTSLPLNVAALDYGSMWTSWWGAVTGPE